MRWWSIDKSPNFSPQMIGPKVPHLPPSGLSGVSGARVISNNKFAREIADMTEAPAPKAARETPMRFNCASLPAATAAPTLISSTRDSPMVQVWNWLVLSALLPPPPFPASVWSGNFPLAVAPFLLLYWSLLSANPPESVFAWLTFLFRSSASESGEKSQRSADIQMEKNIEKSYLSTARVIPIWTAIPRTTQFVTLSGQRSSISPIQ